MHHYLNFYIFFMYILHTFCTTDSHWAEKYQIFSVKSISQNFSMEIFPTPFFVLLNFLICKRKTKDMLKNSLLFSTQVCLKCQNQKFFCLYFLLPSIVFSSKFVRWMDVIYCKIFSHLSPLGDLWIAACSLQTPFSVTSAHFHKEILKIPIW